MISMISSFTLALLLTVKTAFAFYSVAEELREATQEQDTRERRLAR